MMRDGVRIHFNDWLLVTPVLLLLLSWSPDGKRTEALILRPRFTGPVGYYLQRQAARQPWNRTTGTDTLLPSWKRMLESIQPEAQSDMRDQDLENFNVEDQSQEGTTTNCSLPESPSGCDQPHGRGTASPIDSQSARRQELVESFQRRLLRQLGLTEVPRVTEDSWSAVPRVIQQRMKAKVLSSNKIPEAPPTDNEEKEALFLLEPFPMQINSMSALTFTIRIADDMEHRQIISGHIHAENLNGIPSGLDLELWEITTRWPDDPPEFEEIPAREIQSFEPDISPFESDLETGGPISIKLVQPIISTVTTQKLLQTVSFDITSRLKQWIKFRTRTHRPNGQIAPVVKQVLLVCRGCAQDQVPIIDPKKVVLDVRYSSLPRRHRRSVELNDMGLINRCHPDGHQFTCCTQSLQIRFAEIGWDKWIVFPDQVEPNFCHGTCQSAGTRSMHYEMLDLLQRHNASRFNGARKENIRSCCYPTRRASFSILYVDAEKEVRMHVLHNFIVLGCGCS